MTRDKIAEVAYTATRSFDKKKEDFNDLTGIELKVIQLTVSAILGNEGKSISNMHKAFATSIKNDGHIKKVKDYDLLNIDFNEWNKLPENRKLRFKVIADIVQSLRYI